MPENGDLVEVAFAGAVNLAEVEVPPLGGLVEVTKVVVI